MSIRYLLRGEDLDMANNRYIIVEEQGWADETFDAFAANATAHAIDQVSEDISEEHGFVYTETSAKRLARNRQLGPRVSGGEIGVPMYTRGTPTLLYYALGKVVTSEPVQNLTPPNYRHVITPANTVPSFRMAVGKDIKEHRYVGCAVKSVKIDYTVGDVALATFDLLVRKELEPGDLLTPTFPDYDQKERSFLGVEVGVTVDGRVVGYVRSFSLEINNDLVEDNHSFGSRFLPDLRVQGLTITGSMTLAYTNIDRYNDVLNETEGSFSLVFTKGTIGTAGYRQVDIILPKLSYDSGKLPTDSNKEYVLEVNFTAEITPGETEDGVAFVVHNDEAGTEVSV